MNATRVSTGAVVGAVLGIATSFTLWSLVGAYATLVGCTVGAIAAWLACGPREFATAVREQIQRQQETHRFQRPSWINTQTIMLTLLFMAPYVIKPEWSVVIFGVEIFAVALCRCPMSTWPVIVFVSFMTFSMRLGVTINDPGPASLSMVIAAAFALSPFFICDILGDAHDTTAIGRLLPKEKIWQKVSKKGLNANIGCFNGLHVTLSACIALPIMITGLIIFGLIMAIVKVHNYERAIAATDAAVVIIAITALCGHWRTDPLLSFAATCIGALIAWPASQLHVWIWRRVKEIPSIKALA